MKRKVLSSAPKIAGSTPAKCLPGSICIASAGLAAYISISNLLITHPGTIVSGQTQYEFVPGSRQARPVTNWQPPAQQYSNAPRTGGMTLRVPANMQQSAGRLSQPAYQGRQMQQYQQGSSRQQGTLRQQSTAGQQNTDSRQPAAKGNGRSYDFTDSVSVDGINRTYHVHIPPSYDRTRPTPLVLAFHGLSMNGMAMLAMSGFNGLSDRKGFIVVYGDGLNNRWSDGTAGGADDFAFVDDMLKKLAGRVNIDQRRIYACGISNGGFFTQRLACHMSNRIAAAGVVASSMMNTAQLGCANRMPIIFFLGTEDPLLPWADGRTKALGKLGESLGLGGLGSIDNPMAAMGGLTTVPDMINFWCGVNGCGGSPTVTQMPDRDSRDGTTVKKESYGSGDVVVYVIEGGGHSWPGMIELHATRDILGTTSQDIDASEVMWDFFQRHSR